MSGLLRRCRAGGAGSASPTWQATAASTALRRSFASGSFADPVVNLRPDPQPKPEPESVVFGRTMSDHMFLCDWDAEEGWGTAQIVPHEPIGISPSCLGLHLGISCFEGMKAYRDAGGAARLFRPDMNMKRFQRSLERIALPPIDEEALIDGIRALVRTDESWVPDGDGFSLYLRPMCFASEAYLGVGVPQSATLLVACAQAAPYFKGGMSGGIRLYAEPAAVRAWPGGAGSHKLAGNYAPTIVSMRDARAGAEPYDDVLWLFGEDRQITEVGSSNFAAVLGKPDGGAELVTAPLSRGDILPGVTRDSVLHLARGMEAEGLTVSERTLTISDIAAAAESGMLLEAFGCGTAAVISPVKSLSFEGEEYMCAQSPGPWAQRLYGELTDIQYGRKEGPEGWSVVC
jgi:branched-chain amino acid aminotransferase